MKHTTIIVTILAIGWVAPIVIGIALWTAPSVVTREGDAGTFLTADVTPCGYGCDTVTNVHTSRGTFIVEGVFSTALTGSVMTVRDTTAEGIELCIAQTADACSPLASGYSGPLRTVGKAPWGLSHDARMNGILICAFWVPMGLLALLIYMIGTEGNAPDRKTPAPRD